ncbi:MAG: DUF2695 domain-containing protein [Clostridia bacterium]|nr:DUF2695 domain-containing protein [Clostridia bacterium]
MATYLLTLHQAASLLEYLKAQLNKSVCDQSCKHTKQWLAMNIPHEQHEAILSEMEALGGYCDCEILMNCYEKYEEVFCDEMGTSLKLHKRAESKNVIETYLANLQEINDMTLDDFGSRRKVRKTNKLADSNRRIAVDIEERYPEQKESFAKLLLHHNWKIRCQVAHHMLEVMNYSTEYRKMAFDEIKDVINKDISVESFGNKIWLDQWYKEHPEDMSL